MLCSGLLLSATLAGAMALRGIAFALARTTFRAAFAILAALAFALILSRHDGFLLVKLRRLANHTTNVLRYSATALQSPILNGSYSKSEV